MKVSQHFAPTAGLKFRRSLALLALVAAIFLALDLSKPPRGQTATKLALHAIDFYQTRVSTLLPLVRCRYKISCSNYAREAIGQHGLWLGAQMTAKRLLRCF